MLYNQPFDQPSNPNASYTNGNPGTGTNGSIPPAAAIEYPQREIVNLITDCGTYTPSNSDLHQLSKSVQTGIISAGMDTGVQNSLVVNLTPALANHVFMMRILVYVAITNSGPAVIEVNGLSAVPIVRLDGTALIGGELQGDGFALLAYDGAGHYQVLSTYLNVAGASTSKAPKLIGFKADQSTGGGTSIPVSTATVMTYHHMIVNNLSGTSTFTSNSTLTIGAGEAGIWEIAASVHMPTATNAYFEQIAIWQNGIQVDTGTTTNADVGGGSYVAMSANIKTVVGDTIQIKMYHQSSSGTLTTAADETTNFSAFLISAY